MIHYYILLRSDPEKHDAINRLLTGELGTWRNLLPREGPPPPRPRLPRPPPWTRMRQADIERFERLRAQSAADAEARQA